MFILIDDFAPIAYEIDTARGERNARIALAAAGIEWAPVWAGSPDRTDAYRTSAKLFAEPGDDEITQVYLPSADLLRAAGRSL